MTPGVEALLQANERLVVAALDAQAIAEQAKRERDAAALASQLDSLTGTPNRACMLDRLRVALATAQRRQTKVAVLFIDVDDFKRINDSFGHPVGDCVLQCIARRLQSSVRETDTVGRFGGEEFLVLLEDVDASAAIPRIVEHLLEVMAEPKTIGEHTIHLSASLGVAIYPDDGTDAAALIACSDAAMYRAKRRGPGGYAFCHDLARHADGSAQALLPAATDAANASRAHAARGEAGERARVEALQEANGRLVVSALQAQEQETRVRAAHARQLGAMAMAAHELRSPLAPIRIAAGMLDRVRDDPGQFSRLQVVIDNQVTHVVRLVDDLIDGSRVATGKMHLQPAAADLRQVLEAALLNCRPNIDAWQQRLETDLPGDGAMPLHADHTRLVQVFTNLLDNASKYSPRGGRIGLSALRVAGACVVHVEDDGIGIPADVLPHVFDLFVQDHDTVDSRARGLGVGLAVVRELVEAHGGTVEGSSDGPGRGSRFTVTLPVAGSAGQVAVPGAAPVASPVAHTRQDAS